MTRRQRRLRQANPPTFSVLTPALTPQFPPPPPPQQGCGGGYGHQQGGYPNGSGGYGAAPSMREEGPSNVVRLRGLPFSAGKDDIIRWFEDVQVTPPSQEG